MPPQPLFKSERVQFAAVAVIAGTLLLGVTGLAKLQAGDRHAYLKTPINQRQTMPEPDRTEHNPAITIETPSDWQTIHNEPGLLVTADPSKPDRQVTLATLKAGEQNDPVQAAKQFLAKHIDEAELKTFKLISDPMSITIADTGLKGIQFIGTTTGVENAQRLHMLACLTLDGKLFWWVYLTDTVEPGENQDELLSVNINHLQYMYMSAKIVEE